MTSWSETDIPPLRGKTALITGSNSGIGLEVAKVLAAHGARILMACRNMAKAEAAAEQIRSVATGDVEIVQVDLASLASVEAAAKLVIDQEDRLDLLLNNAGLMAVDEAKTEDGFEMQFGVNHLGHFALTGHLAPLVLGTPGSRVVTMSSFGHRAGVLRIDDLFFERRRYDRWRPYFQSKLANILFTLELQRRLEAAGAETIALASHPGGSHTDLGSEGSGILNRLVAPAYYLAESPAQGAMPMVRAAVDPNARGGEFYGPRLMGWGPAVREKPSRRARNADDARALWLRSEELTDIKYL